MEQIKNILPAALTAAPVRGKARTMQREALQATITRCLPELAGREFTLLTRGWDCVAVDVGDELVFKFPRHAAAEERLARETTLLSVIRSAVTMSVPDLSLHDGPPIFSRHAKLRGEHLVSRQYERLPARARDALGAEMALFYSELHRLETSRMAAVGATAIQPWLPAEDILRHACPLLPPDLAGYAEVTVAEWQALPPDPYGTSFGYFDGHGWNMAFDHASERLNGVYDFGDSGFGALHQEFIYSNWISPDLTARITAHYEVLTGRVLDRRRIDLLTGVHRLSELAEYADSDRHAPAMIENVIDWARHQARRGGVR